MSMAASLEARIPLLDHRLVEFAASLPTDLKVHGFTRKYLLRKVAAELLPEPILRRRKKGFPVPMAAWLRGDAREMCTTCSRRMPCAAGAFSRPERVAGLLEEHDSGTADNAPVLWALLSLELWHRAFVDGERPATAAPVGTGRA